MSATNQARSEYEEIKKDFKNVKDEARDRFADDIDSLKESFTQLRSDVHQMFSDAVGTGKAGARVVGDHADRAYGQIKDGAKDIKDRGADQIDMIGKKISENPLTSAAIAFGVGFILSRLMSRR